MADKVRWIRLFGRLISISVALNVVLTWVSSQNTGMDDLLIIHHSLTICLSRLKNHREKRGIICGELELHIKQTRKR